MADAPGPAFNLAIGVVLLLQQLPSGPIAPWSAGAAPAAHPIAGSIIRQQTIPPGGRTVLTVRTSGIVETVIYEDTGDPRALRTFHGGGIPRAAKVFTNMRELDYPLASEPGGDFYVRVRPLVAGRTAVQFQPGTIARAMAHLRNGRNLVRNRGTVLVSGPLHTMPVYQLVPGTIVRLTRIGGDGSVALLKTREYVAVRKGDRTLASHCIEGACLRSTSRAQVLELRLDDYDDRYVAASSDGRPLIFTYQVIATPETLNYITTCI